MRICPRCSFEVTDDSKICRACGSILDDVEVPGPRQAETEMAQDETPDCTISNTEVPATPILVDEPADIQDATNRPWTCPTCGEHIERDFSVCWNCGTAEDGTVDPGFIKVEDVEDAKESGLAEEDDEDGAEKPGFAKTENEDVTKDREFVKVQVVAECPFARSLREGQSVGSNPMESDVSNIVFVGFNSRVAALDRITGKILWNWKSPTGRGYVSLLVLDSRQLIASVNGYTYCLDPLTGRQLWYNELPGFGSGVTSIAVLGKHNAHDQLLAAAAADEAARAAAASSNT